MPSDEHDRMLELMRQEADGLRQFTCRMTDLYRSYAEKSMSAFLRDRKAAMLDRMSACLKQMKTDDIQHSPAENTEAKAD